MDPAREIRTTRDPETLSKACAEKLPSIPFTAVTSTELMLVNPDIGNSTTTPLYEGIGLKVVKFTLTAVNAPARRSASRIVGFSKNAPGAIREPSGGLSESGSVLASSIAVIPSSKVVRKSGYVLVRPSNEGFSAQQSDIPISVFSGTIDASISM